MTEHVSRNGKRFDAPRRTFDRWNDMPYGIWTTKDGRQILFNRFYEPIWQRRGEAAPEPADASEWVKDITGQSWFYGDTHRSEAAMRRLAVAALKAWGIADGK